MFQLISCSNQSASNSFWTPTYHEKTILSGKTHHIVSYCPSVYLLTREYREFILAYSLRKSTAAGCCICQSENKLWCGNQKREKKLNKTTSWKKLKLYDSCHVVHMCLIKYQFLISSTSFKTCKVLITTSYQFSLSLSPSYAFTFGIKFKRHHSKQETKLSWPTNDCSPARACRSPETAFGTHLQSIRCIICQLDISHTRTEHGTNIQTHPLTERTKLAFIGSSRGHSRVPLSKQWVVAHSRKTTTTTKNHGIITVQAPVLPLAHK